MSWVNESIFYHIYPLGFCGAPKDNPGGEPVQRIRKVEDWIPHLKSLHVNAVYLGPVFSSVSHGYDTSDYYKVDERLGDNQAFKEVCAALHENGIRIILDGVFNHVGRDFWAFRDVREKKQDSQYCGWFHNLNFGGSSPCGDPFWYEGWGGHYSLVKLNLRNPQVVDHLLGAVDMWMREFGIDGLRLDAADCVDNDFFRRLRSFCKEKNPDFWLMGEIIHGDYNRWANPAMLDSVTNYECHKGLYSSHNEKNYFEIGYSLNRQFGNGGIYRGLCLYNFTDNHDVNRLASFVRNQAHLPLVYAILYTMPGAPSLYYGSEWGIKGERSKTSDEVLRPCLELDSIPDGDEALCNVIRWLGRVRCSLTALQYGSYSQCMLKNEQFVYCRSTEEQRVYIALNLSDHSEYIEFPGQPGKITDLWSKTEFESNDGNFKLEMPAFGIRIFVTPHWQVDGLLQGEDCKMTSSVPRQAPQIVPEKIEQNDEITASRNEVDLKSIPVVPGRYCHFKGGEYQVLGVAIHSETGEKLVVYQALYGEQGLWVRPEAMFQEIVERDGKRMPRFRRIDDR